MKRALKRRQMMMNGTKKRSEGKEKFCYSFAVKEGRANSAIKHGF